MALRISYQILIFLFLFGVTLSSPLQPLVNRSTRRDDDEADNSAHCTPASAFTIFKFIAVNFVAHCFTLKSKPGESARNTFFAALQAFFTPTFGIERAYEGVIRHSRLSGRNEIEQAARAGALVMVSRVVDRGQNVPLWNPGLQDIDACVTCDSPEPEWAPILLIKYGIRKNKNRVDPLPIRERYYDTDMKVHGSWAMPEGFEFSIVPSDAVIETLVSKNAEAEERVVHHTLASSFNFAKAALGIAQTGSAAYALYKSSGGLLKMYGYATFGLAVTPYIVMAFFNFVANLVTSDYPALYMVHTLDMDDARRKGGSFHGVIARLVNEPTPKPKINYRLHKEQHWRLDRQLCYTKIETPDITGTTCVFLGSPEATSDAAPSSVPRLPAPTFDRVWSRDAEEADVSFADCHDFRIRRDPSNFLNSRSNPRAVEFVLDTGLPFLVGCLILAIIAGLSHGFSQGTISTRAQRVWNLLWIIGGNVIIHLVVCLGNLRIWAVEKNRITKPMLSFCTGGICFFVWIVLIEAILWLPGIGGLINLVQMMRVHGNCDAT